MTRKSRQIPSLEHLMGHLHCWPTIAPFVDKGLSLHSYQIDSVLTVVNHLQGRAILADEVGLGKTIEAGLIIAELKAQGLVDRVLILVPAGLITQWIQELKNKFGWQALHNAHDQGWLWVLSIDTAKRPPLYQQLQYVPWDLVIVDEAHHLKNTKTLNYQLVEGLQSRYLVLLTATPMENELTELYTLVNLVKPGLFGNYLRFYRQFILDKRTPKNARALKKLLSQVMVRNQRQDVGLSLPPREVTLWPIVLSEAERRLYDTMTHALKVEYRQRLQGNQTVLPLITLQRELCSSPQALIPTLESSTWLGSLQEELLELARSIPVTAKIRAISDLIRVIGGKVLIFTEYRASQQMIVDFLRDQGILAEAFHGGLTRTERDRLIAWFADGDHVLVSTEAGGQGLNLQFCHQLINFDLPWNPMRIEQRIGRVHRMGQEHPVEIYNLFTVDTIEENILHLLHEKIDLFRHVIGELDVILRHLERRGSLEKRLLDIFFWEDDRKAIEMRLEALGQEFLAARRRLSWPHLDKSSTPSESTGQNPKESVN
ncbi:DEAD/DEAH box helicase [Sulfobacillus thermosulfidooxidans]|uniref:DEAD/DEAH box helicase n=1 Tax=Sulfobacillus thermosulfidooxidans TaxID=28034 RepID=UPI00096BBEBC|nr:SNF2-related protein [Sulfobacillus thermosulfidooxidans]OLZ12207.1 helicase [Sulfobacillus thermosulfidooxidans]OLZ13012.1 helicase [Sulfobacillus thermosulfidooxidans]OLZ21393.1 helicase [Sulfobacillus thermosulfidooxidans]